MKIMIAASSVFAKEMVLYRDQLRKLGHENNLHEHYVAQANGQMKDLIDRMHREHSAVKKEFDYIRLHYNEIKESDAVLVLNFDKNGIHNYIGANTFLEIGYAHVLNKKIYLLNDMPDQTYIKDELEAMEPIILNGDLTKIS